VATSASHNSCRDRHCPKCQSLAQAAWLERRCSELLNTTYFHVVFTVPEPVAAIAYHNKVVVYDILFRAAAENLRTIATDPKQLARNTRAARRPAFQGGHNRTVFGELGLSKAEIDGYIAAGALVSVALSATIADDANGTAKISEPPLPASAS
jgi:hypothetical protein